MSTYMLVKCTACHETCDPNMNHHEELIKSFWLMREKLAALSEMDTQGYLEIHIMGYGTTLPHFFMEHATHPLELWDEYGHQYDWETLERRSSA